ncbi:hypothetical protein KTT_32380 [Tengunoibacter tsumagoiensis]|uniref:Glycosyltransferase RgtA/B/C/D-like domain-containing protein n=1 Tax=Tengunoibacter tsumagoiensis TaxID=2014871 RepID=A0A402A2V0_9CHLR|nr:hypothetical protein KTT_32380 [Tengunoibacter tsumagoiensis]
MQEKKVWVKIVAFPTQCAIDIKHCLDAWDTWDVGVFVDVAHRGYPSDTDKQDLVAFFPAWPLVLHLVGDHGGDPYQVLFYVGLILTNLSFYGALVLLYLLVARRFGADIGKNTLFLLALSPYGLFFFVGYSEAFFLLLCVALFTFLERGHWWLAGACGFVAALTRSVGIVLVLPFLVVLLQDYVAQRRVNWRLAVGRLMPALLVPLGLLLYMSYLGMIKGNMLAFTVAEVSWGRSLNFPWAGFVDVLKSFVYWRQNFEENVMDFLFTLFPMITLVLWWKRLPLTYSIFTTAMIFFALLHPIQGINYPLSSSPRFMLVLFPLYILLAIWCKNERVRSVLFPLSCALFTINALLFICHGWVA